MSFLVGDCLNNIITLCTFLMNGHNELQLVQFDVLYIDDFSPVNLPQFSNSWMNHCQKIHVQILADL